MSHEEGAALSDTKFKLELFYRVALHPFFCCFNAYNDSDFPIIYTPLNEYIYLPTGLVPAEGSNHITPLSCSSAIQGGEKENT